MSRFVLQPSQTSANGWVCTDTENGIVCVFDNKKFNNTQQFTLLDDMKPDASMLARVANEMADWLVKNHREKL